MKLYSYDITIETKSAGTVTAKFLKQKKGYLVTFMSGYSHKKMLNGDYDENSVTYRYETLTHCSFSSLKRMITRDYEVAKFLGLLKEYENYKKKENEFNERFNQKFK
tara:strand:+ start:29 stop:349 length:321 start_codon:yes stop_codon:yes gene_type:complete